MHAKAPTQQTLLHLCFGVEEIYGHNWSQASVFKSNWLHVVDITTLFISIILLCGTDNIMHNVPADIVDPRSVLHDDVSPTEHWYGFE